MGVAIHITVLCKLLNKNKTLVHILTTISVLYCCVAQYAGPVKEFLKILIDVTGLCTSFANSEQKYFTVISFF